MFEKTEKIFGWVYKFFDKFDFNTTVESYIGLLVNIAILSGLVYVIYLVCRFVLVTGMAIVAQKTRTKFDDLLISNETAKYMSHLIPLIYIYKAVPIILDDFTSWETVFGRLVGVYIVLLTLWIVISILKAIRDYLKTKPEYMDKPIDSYLQVVIIMLWILGVITIVAKIFDVSTDTLVKTLGAVSALIILIFRDTILGFVASVQVSANDLIRIGDWITMDKFGADGDVIEINLTTLKVRNFDHTITTIPTYSLISDSFRNWRGMIHSDGRRIKRHILIKANSIRFLREEELEDFNRIQLLSSYIQKKQVDIKRHNQLHEIDKSLSINGRNLTNFGLFRKYITKYLESYPGLNKDMILLCRQLQPTQYGIPLEIYCFSNDKRFENYEYIMSDIFDHILAAIIYFDLQIFELPAGKNNLEE